LVTPFTVINNGRTLLVGLSLEWHMPTPIEIELESTWPPEFLAQVQTHRSLVLDYQGERARIDRILQSDDWEARLNPPSNRHQSDYETLASRLDKMLAHHRLVGYHCTCLTQREIASIKAEGMRPLSMQLIQEKFRGAVSDGFLTRSMADLLLGHEYLFAAMNNQSGNRTGMTWFCANRSTLTEASGVCNLFRYWGGEATRGGPAGHPEILREIGGIGTSCIVKCAVPYVDSRRHYDNYAERFLSRSVADDIEYPEPPAGFEFYVTVPVAAANVLNVIEYEDAEFEDLTRSKSWRIQDSINRQEREKWDKWEFRPITPMAGAPGDMAGMSDEELLELMRKLEEEV
jgi:hypothetical protein